MGNIILNHGVVTPFVLFKFATGTIEATIQPKYFVSLTHNRTCKQACTFKLTVIYVPETFTLGNPTLIDNMLISSKNQRVTYQYGYYSWDGRLKVQYRTYSGQFNKYTCDVDVASGTLTYTIEGNAVAIDLLNKQVSLNNTYFNKIRYTPSQVVELCSRDDGAESDTNYMAHDDTALARIQYGVSANDAYAESSLRHLASQRPFADIGKYYHRHIVQTDDYVKLPDLYSQQGMMDIILGTPKAAKDSDNQFKNTNVNRDGGLVQHSRIALAEDPYQAYTQGILTLEEYYAYRNAYGALYSYGHTNDETLISQYSDLLSELNQKMYVPFMAFFDDSYNMTTKYGTFYYIPKRGLAANNSFRFDYGNNQKESDVISISFSYDGSVAMANATASSSLSGSIDATGNNIGQSNSTTCVLSLGRNSYPTLSGFNEDKFLSQRELTEYLIYPMTASMKVLGQIEPNNLLDVIEVNVYINGTKHPSLSGEYSVTSVIDEVDSNGFYTTFELVRAEYSNTIKYEKYVTNPADGKAAETSNKITAS